MKTKGCCVCRQHAVVVGGNEAGRRADRQLAVCECVCSSWQCVCVCARAPSNQLGGGGGGAIKRAKERAGERAATETISLSAPSPPRAFSLSPSLSQSTLLFVSSVLPPFSDRVSEGWAGVYKFNLTKKLVMPNTTTYSYFPSIEKGLNPP